jgi:tRNA nucleotidyltransferase (CCA-adding enzyme)
MRFSFPNEVLTVIGLLEQGNNSAYLVGGSVRDMIMGREPKDYDIATSHNPENVIKIMEDNGYHTVPTGIKFGTVTVLINEMLVEVSTFRSNEVYTDKRHPDTLTYKNSIQDDLGRRDFTMNSLACHPDHEVVDLYDGMEDINNKIIRCVGDSNRRFEEDALRMFRAVRFASQLNFDIEKNTLDSIKSNAYLAKYVSKERVQIEFNKILMSKYPVKGIELLCETTLIDSICPEFVKTIGFNQNNPHHNLPLNEHIYAVICAVPEDITLRLSAFFHDLGKPYTKTTDEKGISHFHGHAFKSEGIAYTTMKTLKYDNETILNVTKLVKFHDTRVNSSKSAVKKFMVKIGDLFKKWSLLCVADIHGQSYFMKSQKLIDIINTNMLYEQILQNDEPTNRSKLAINGKEIREMGYEEGRKIGEILEYCLNLVIEDSTLNDKNKLKKIIEKKFL